MRKWINHRPGSRRLLCAVLALVMMLGLACSALPQANAAGAVAARTNPATSDNSPVVYFLVLMALSLLAIIILAIHLGRKNKK